MNSEQKVCIVIPLYTMQLSADEWYSLERCRSVFSGKYPIVAAVPDDLDTTPLTDVFPDIALRKFNADYFFSIADYNRLMLAPEFYDAFESWEYILIYQSDAWVFRDRLEAWCNSEWDYVGAPWLFRPRVSEPFTLMIRTILLALHLYHTDFFRYKMVGNGGVSLRRVSKFREISRKQAGKLKRRAMRGRLNEDVFWSFEATDMKIPDWDTALHFSADMIPYLGPETTLDPDFCHGWNKNTLTREFWMPRISTWQH